MLLILWSFLVHRLLFSQCLYASNRISDNFRSQLSESLAN